MRYLFFIFCLSILLFSCSKEKTDKNIEGAVYHWKSTYNPSKKAKETMEDLRITKEYIRFFDIDFDKEVLPKGMISFKSKPKKTIVPVVYITNNTFDKLPLTEIPALAVKTVTKIKSIAEENELNFNEVQLDCDWTKNTAPAYFRFLNEISDAFEGKVKLSCTLRLHQVKFKEQTGIPPVERVTLMLYNVGDWTNVNTKNSLFDPEVIDQYIYRLPEYPLPVDIALPIYQQALVFRNNKFHTYFKNVSKTDLIKEFNMKASESDETLICQENCEFRSFSFRKGDVFRHESADFRTMNKVKKAILERITNKDVQILFFHLDDKSLKNFTKKQYQKLLEN
jgi:hypothetical protein